MTFFAETERNEFTKASVFFNFDLLSWLFCWLEDLVVLSQKMTNILSLSFNPGKSQFPIYEFVVASC